jgi:hypothetical protein
MTAAGPQDHQDAALTGNRAARIINDTALR